MFGKRAKQMRLSKLSELIHRSAAHPDCDRAEVKVTFQDILDHEDEPDYFEVVPGSVFSVARRVNPSSQSQYYINGKPRTYEEVGKVLRKKGIDLDHNRFLILQGEVEQISLMKPKGQNENETGLLEYLEDIIGSNKYIEEIEKVAVEVEDCNEARLEQTNRVKASHSELMGLEEERRVAVDWLKAERRLYRLTLLLHFLKMDGEIKLYNQALEAITELKKQLKEKKDQKRELVAQNDGLIKLITETSKQHEAEKATLEKLTAAFD